MNYFYLVVFTILFLFGCDKPNHSVNNNFEKVINNYKYDSVLSNSMKNDVYVEGYKKYDSENNTYFLNGFIYVDDGKNSLPEVGSFIFNFKEGISLNSQVDLNKSETRIEDGESNKSFIGGVSREFGVKFYSEYDDESLNKTAMLNIDTSNQMIKLSITKNQEVLSCIVLKGNNIIIEKGIPSYKSTRLAVEDNNLVFGSLFKVSNGDGSSSINVKQ